MAIATTSATLPKPLPNLNSPLHSLHTRTINSISSSSLHFGHTLLHKLTISHTISSSSKRFSGFKPHGFVSCSLSNESSVDEQVEDKSLPNTSSNDLVKSCAWNWRGYSIRYQCSGSNGPALVLVHGFGANRSTSLIFRFSLADN
ncbi:hypothetical protein Pint_31410 [Pistacia integerrima]|uniref:Uncharacterized protein n=1 Tax=Pistacia integerrima TaxID=434235 RepID=A0ACC0XQT3_9ROSI|nr:hypothetical protein Pint_31410 [Pistacia integerrima]